MGTKAMGSEKKGRSEIMEEKYYLARDLEGGSLYFYQGNPTLRNGRYEPEGKTKTLLYLNRSDIPGVEIAPGECVEIKKPDYSKLIVPVGREEKKEVKTEKEPPIVFAICSKCHDPLRRNNMSVSVDKRSGDIAALVLHFDPCPNCGGK